MHMKRFLLSSTLFLVILLITFYCIFIQADGYTDPFYLRFATPKKHSLILGTSRAAQTIMPRILNQTLSRNDLFNYSFTVGHSSYGPTYLESIKRKLNSDAKKGIFIISVDPWSISSNTEDPNDSSSFEELKLALSGTRFVNCKPNIQYLLKYYDKRFWNLIFNPDSTMLLHDDGWFELTVPMDSASVEERTKIRIQDYRNIYSSQYKFSSVRFNYVIQTIKYLQNFGTVYLVRLPVHPLMMQIESKQMPDFNDKIQKIAGETQVDYLDMTDLNSAFTYVDGNHLHKDSGKKVSEIIGNWIMEKKSDLTRDLNVQ